LAQVAPALAALEAAEEVVNDFRVHPAGQVRLSVPRGIASCVLLPKLRAFAERFPDVRLDIAAENGFVDIVSAGFDAGVRLDGSVARDMVARRITPPVQAVIVAAPDYVARCPAPQSPQDLAGHRCIGFRQLGGGRLYRWEFVRDGQAFDLGVPSALVLDDPELMLDAAKRGLGLAYALDVFCRDALADGRLLPVLEGRANVVVTEPLEYGAICTVMNRSDLVLTDSGGIQEEAPALSKPVLVLRENTERPEAVEHGVARVVGTDENRIVEEASILLSRDDEYAKMAHAANPYGDGRACERILAATASLFGRGEPLSDFVPHRQRERDVTSENHAIV